MEKKFILLALISSLFITTSANALEKIEIKASLDKSLESLNKREFVVYNEAREIVFKHTGLDLDTSLKQVSEGKNLYKVYNEAEWQKEEDKLRTQIELQLSPDLDPKQREFVLNNIISKIKATHTVPAIEYSILEKGYKDINSYAGKKKLAVVFIPKYDCKDCEGQKFDPADIEKKFPDIAVLEVAIK